MAVIDKNTKRTISTRKGTLVVRNNKGKKKSPLEKGIQKQAKDIKEGAKQIWP